MKKTIFAIAILAVLTLGAQGVSATAGKCCATLTGNTSSGGNTASSCCAEPDTASGSVCAAGQTEVDCSSVSSCPTTSAAATTCSSGAAAGATDQAPAKAEFPIIFPKIPLNIPTISLPEFTNVTQKDGYIYIPFISVFLVGAYKMGVGVAAILAVIMIMAGGFIWIAAAGDSGKIGQAKKMISGAVVGLVLTLGSYVALQTVNPNLVNFTALKIQEVAQHSIEVIADDQESDITDNSQLPSTVQKPTWTADTFSCSSPPPAAGVANPGSLISLDNCPTGISSSGKMGTQALHDALCSAGTAANAAGYAIYVSSAYRTFASQVSLWCGDSRPPAERKKYIAVPGFSNHGSGNAVDVVLEDSHGKDLYSISSSAQCNADPSNVQLINKYMTGAGFVRYQNEIWHFEVGTQGQALRGTNYGMPPKCTQ
jgi:LAS superfamily LD-carboxypeptidase LdcB